LQTTNEYTRAATDAAAVIARGILTRIAEEEKEWFSPLSVRLENLSLSLCFSSFSSSRVVLGKEKNV
jgi:hypothetical protein